MAAAAVVLGGGLAACSGSADEGDEAGGDDIEGVDLGEGGGGGGGDDAGADTAGAGDDGDDGDAASVVAAVESLLADYDRLAHRLMADPALVLDPEEPALQEYRALFAPGSELAEASVAQWAGDAEAGRSIGSTVPGEPPIATRLDGEVPAPGGDELAVPTCHVDHYAVYGPDGRVLDTVEDPGSRGTTTAVLVDGEWRLQQIEIVVDGTTCRTESEAP
jgi:hypothetical protein